MTIPAAPAPGRRAANPVRALAAFEGRVHAREFTTWLCALVFLALTVGHAGGGPIELVGDRGTVPRSAPWALAQAMAGLTAFGQVMTAIIAATSVLRDVAAGTQPLILAAPLAWRDYLLGRFVGALGVMAAVYLVLPVGLALGVLADGQAAAIPALAAPLLLLVAPTVVAVTALFFTVGALSGGFAAILLLGLGLVACWQTGLHLVHDGRAVGALLDPFGNAALTWATRTWDAAARSARPMPVDGWLLANRALWLSIAAACLAWTLQRWRPRLAAPARARAGVARAAASHAPRIDLAPLRGTGAWSQVGAYAAFGFRWTVAERGFLALAIIAALNAIANAWSAAPDMGEVLRALEFHARVPAILIATIYAGELVWRDRELRIAPLFAVLPGPPPLRLVGRTLGVIAAQGVLVGILLLAALALVRARGTMPPIACALGWMAGVAWPLFAGLLLASLAVHLVVRRKAAAHLLLISLWVGAIALGATGLARPWPAFGRCG